MYYFYHWRIRIQDAHDEDAIARVIQDYGMTLSPAMVESLPAECRVALRSRDLPHAALILLQAAMDFKGAPEATAQLHEIANIYAAASVRVTHLRGGG